MPTGIKTIAKSKDSSATVGFEAVPGLAAGRAEARMQKEGPNRPVQPFSFLPHPLALPAILRALIEADLGPEQTDTFRRDLYADLRAD